VIIVLINYLLISTCLLFLDRRCKFILYHRSHRHSIALLPSSYNFHLLFRGRWGGSFTLRCLWCRCFLSLLLLLLLASCIFCGGSLNIFLNLLLSLHLLIPFIFGLFNRCLFRGLLRLSRWRGPLFSTPLLGRWWWDYLTLFFLHSDFLLGTRFFSHRYICVLRWLLLYLFIIFFSFRSHLNINHLFFRGHQGILNIKVQFSFG
jgi:hypothetical protein